MKKARLSSWKIPKIIDQNEKDQSRRMVCNATIVPPPACYDNIAESQKNGKTEAFISSKLHLT